VGDGAKTYFWTNLWLEEGLLYDRFKRLFNLSEFRNVLLR